MYIANNTSLSISGKNLTVLSKGSISGILVNNQLIVPVKTMAGSTVGTMTITVDDASKAPFMTIKSARIEVDCVFGAAGQYTNVRLGADLKQVPASGKLIVKLQPEDVAQTAAMNATLNLKGKMIVGTPLTVVNVSMVNVANGRDVGPASITIGVGQQGNYSIVRPNGSTYDVLDVTVAQGKSGLEATASSPGGFSVFTLVTTADMPIAPAAGFIGGLGLGDLGLGDYGVYIIVIIIAIVVLAIVLAASIFLRKR